MLEQGDLQLLKAMMTEVVDELVTKVVDERVTRSENMLLDEIGRVQSYLERQIQAVQKNVEELNQYYRIDRLQNDNTAILLKMVDDLSKRVSELERRTA